MASSQMVMFDEEAREVQAICDRLARDSHAKAVICIDKTGLPFAHAGDTTDLDVTSLSSLTAGNVAATGGIAKLLSEKEFSGQFHEGEKTHVHISVVSQRIILVVLFDERSSLGLVRLRVRKASDDLTRVIDHMEKKSATAKTPAVFGEITDEDIDNLFGD